MKRADRARLVALFVLVAVMLIPAIAFAQEAGSDTGVFARQLAKGVVVALGACFVAGLAMSMTPCVWPMIPITVSIFGATQAKSRGQAIALSGTFVLGLATFFGAIGLIAGLTGKAIPLHNPYVLAAVSLVFFALAASMFGAFEIALPSSLQNRLSSVGGIGYKGAFILGLVMALVAAPCTTAFIFGLFGYVAEQHSAVLGFTAFFLLALGMGVPFFLAGAFAMSLPKPGAWMMGVKWVCGVVLVYMGLSYLRDGFAVVRKLVLPSSAYITIGVVALALGVILGALHIAAERRRAKNKHMSTPFKLMSLLPATGGAFMVVSWISLPPGEPATTATTSKIEWFSDEAAAVAKAKAEHRPILVDFGAEWCPSCKELEEKTFPDPRVVAEGKRFVGVKVDATDDDAPNVKELGQKYQVDLTKLPDVVLVDSTGKVAARFHEYVPPDRFAVALKQVN